MDFWDSADRADNCAAGLWLKKYKAASGSGTTAKAAPAPTPAPAPTKITANDPTFQSNLNQFGADQLLALTNELLETGSVDLAKLARNALLQRFPDSPLVPVVAQLITSASKNGTPAGTPAPPPVSNKSASSAKPAATVAAAAGDRFYINDLPTLVSTFARIGVIMNPVSGSTLEAQESTNLFTAYLSDCSGSRCYAIQLLAKYALTPMPTQDKVQTWNIDKLYGRGYVSGNRVNFDMVLRIPDGGIDIKTLDDFVVLYKGATNSFYNLVKPQ